MGPVTALCPAPRRLTLAGREFLVSEARLAPELCRLQAWLDAQAPDAYGEYLAGNLTAGQAYALAEGGPPTPFDARGRALLHTAEGVCQTLAAALERHHGAPDPAALVALAAGLAPGEFAALERAFYGCDDLGALARALGCVPADPPGTPLTWAGAVFALCERYGWTVAETLALPASVLGLALRGGEPPGWKLPARPGESMAEQVARMQALRGGGDP